MVTKSFYLEICYEWNISFCRPLIIENIHGDQPFKYAKNGQSLFLMCKSFDVVDIVTDNGGAAAWHKYIQGEVNCLTKLDQDLKYVHTTLVLCLLLLVVCISICPFIRCHFKDSEYLLKIEQPWSVLYFNALEKCR